MILKAAVGIIGTIVLFGGCVKIPTTQERTHHALSLLNDTTFSQLNIHTSAFELFTLQKKSAACTDMKVYIEGDGLAWITRNRTSDDPTPLNPIALSLMKVDESSCKVYIARPCQYIKQARCEKKHWTSHRFGSEIIQSFDEALDNLKENHNNTTFTLIGYSGGGAVAALLANKREDVSSLITVAGNLDTDKWVELHSLSPLEGSLNPAQNTKKLETIPQYHLIGSKDEVIPKEVFLSYQNRFDRKENVKHTIYDATHTLGWVEHYQQFLKEYLKNEK